MLPKHRSPLYMIWQDALIYARATARQRSCIVSGFFSWMSYIFFFAFASLLSVYTLHLLLFATGPQRRAIDFG
ncbi:uncharacterized protein BP01DRAFT_178837 [Aspergillus saccharolyticus JOP 1030-1]|uniref:Uncharacterized protein n=1 Tax=Aspergillus saccharolyticus JOP 1030-1 TaxID=1450539 RepID=A0A318ZMP5_9EURO|nr:hypothetical protein BP01DRAFT_178837 [Aspergillus saccharolyticus JOP 1030-1]PYH48247.1 hypothetical protein BP01DRAFT_178837 [Aspergillus saccharolyticus JOP 1030-1]